MAEIESASDLKAEYVNHLCNEVEGSTENLDDAVLKAHAIYLLCLDYEKWKNPTIFNNLLNTIRGNVFANISTPFANECIKQFLRHLNTLSKFQDLNWDKHDVLNVGTVIAMIWDEEVLTTFLMAQELQTEIAFAIAIVVVYGVTATQHVKPLVEAYLKKFGQNPDKTLFGLILKYLFRLPDSNLLSDFLAQFYPPNTYPPEPCREGIADGIEVLAESDDYREVIEYCLAQCKFVVSEKRTKSIEAYWKDFFHHVLIGARRAFSSSDDWSQAKEFVPLLVELSEPPTPMHCMIFTEYNEAWALLCYITEAEQNNETLSTWMTDFLKRADDANEAVAEAGLKALFALCEGHPEIPNGFKHQMVPLVIKQLKNEYLFEITCRLICKIANFIHQEGKRNEVFDVIFETLATQSLGDSAISSALNVLIGVMEAAPPSIQGFLNTNFLKQGIQYVKQLLSDGHFELASLFLYKFVCCCKSEYMMDLMMPDIKDIVKTFSEKTTPQAQLCFSGAIELLSQLRHKRMEQLHMYLLDCILPIITRKGLKTEDRHKMIQIFTEFMNMLREKAIPILLPHLKNLLTTFGDEWNPEDSDDFDICSSATSSLAFLLSYPEHISSEFLGFVSSVNTRSFGELRQSLFDELECYYTHAGTVGRCTASIVMAISKFGPLKEPGLSKANPVVYRLTTGITERVLSDRDFKMTGSVALMFICFASVSPQFMLKTLEPMFDKFIILLYEGLKRRFFAAQFQTDVVDGLLELIEHGKEFLHLDSAWYLRERYISQDIEGESESEDEDESEDISDAEEAENLQPPAKRRRTESGAISTSSKPKAVDEDIIYACAQKKKVFRVIQVISAINAEMCTSSQLHRLSQVLLNFRSKMSPTVWQNFDTSFNLSARFIQNVPFFSVVPQPFADLAVVAHARTTRLIQ